MSSVYRIGWFGVERPVDGATVYVRPPVDEPEQSPAEEPDEDCR